MLRVAPLEESCFSLCPGDAAAVSREEVSSVQTPPHHRRRLEEAVLPGGAAPVPDPVQTVVVDENTLKVLRRYSILSCYQYKITLLFV